MGRRGKSWRPTFLGRARVNGVPGMTRPHPELSGSPQLSFVLTHLERPDVVDQFLTQPPTLIRGWPGLAWVVACLDQAGCAKLTDFWGRWLDLAVPRMSTQSPAPELPDNFLPGSRGREWAQQYLTHRTYPNLTAPPPGDGYDSYDMDCFLHFATYRTHGMLGAPPSRRPENYRSPDSRQVSWGHLVGKMFKNVEQLRRNGVQTILGFAHGITGVLYQMLHLYSVGLCPVPIQVLVDELRWLASLASNTPQGLIWPFRMGDPVPSDSPLRLGLCNGSVGYGVLFLDAYFILGEPDFLEAALGALRAADEDQMGLGFCCGHAGKVALVSRFLRGGMAELIGEDAHSWSRLLDSMRGDLTMTNYSGVTGLTSCLPALCAGGPDSTLLDYYLPPPRGIP